MPKPLDAAQTAAFVEQLKQPEDPPEFLLELLKERVPPGVDEAAYVKASFLAALVKGDVKSPLVDAKEAMRLLGTMQGGYNVAALVEGLELRWRTRADRRRRLQNNNFSLRRLPRRRTARPSRQREGEGGHGVLGQRRVVY